MRAHRVLAEAEPLAEDEGQRESRDAGVDVDRGATGEVDRLTPLAIQPPFSAAKPPNAQTQCATGK